MILYDPLINRCATSIGIRWCVPAATATVPKVAVSPANFEESTSPNAFLISE